MRIAVAGLTALCLCSTLHSQPAVEPARRDGVLIDIDSSRLVRVRPTDVTEV